MNGLGGKRVLVLEDNSIVAMELEERLEAMGLTIVGSFGSVAELEAAAAQPVELAILDVSVRDGTSLELASRLRARDVPCVFVTGYGTVPNLPPELREVPVLHKPIALRALEAVIARLLLGPAAG